MAEYKTKVLQFPGYIRDTWVGLYQHPLMFLPDQWLTYRSINDNSIPAMTGDNEAYNQQLRIMLKGGRVWRVIDSFCSEDSYSR